MYTSFNRWENRGPRRPRAFLGFPNEAGGRSHQSRVPAPRPASFSTFSCLPYNPDPDVRELGAGFSGFYTYREQIQASTELAFTPEKCLG